MFFIIVSRICRVSLARGERSRSTVGPSISWCLKFGFSLGYGLGFGFGFGFGALSESDDDDDDGSLVEKKMGLG